MFMEDVHPFVELSYQYLRMYRVHYRLNHAKNMNMSKGMIKTWVNSESEIQAWVMRLCGSNACTYISGKHIPT